ncbi:DUF790 family protein [Metallosphaera tengchongensis]|uniref:DUF790 family protein n=1 Tax=Metallosphaera tengchongensis TaxID=1532350 RepID=A0A6N0NW68_9CREN|nr:DUF790 family protein [Metallosphaera tengchongensis]QKR00457.1 DUF790 family protein [Metallosphaera tengchongensis]
MLPSELARFRIYDDRIYPSFADQKDLELVNNLISLYKPGVTLGEVEDNVKLLERVYGMTTQGAKLVRGLHRVILRHVKLSGESPVDPQVIRRELFSEGPAINPEDRDERVRRVKEKLGVDVEKFMFGDLDESKTISEVQVRSPEDIIKEYNLSLLQTVMFKSYRVTFTVEDNWKNLLRWVKKLGLMYVAYPNPVRIEVFGPYTLLKPSEKYGRNLALLLPIAVSSREWTVEAEIILGKKKRRVYKLKVENFQWISSHVEEGRIFDSSVEEDVYWSLRSLVKDWKIEREPGPLVVNGRILLPDFLLEKDGFKVYVEVVGFWTEEYLREKVKKLEGTSVPLIALVNEELGVGKIRDLPVITYKRKVDPGKVYSKLKELEGRYVRSVEYSLEGGEVISIKEIALKYGVSESLMRKNLKEFPGYVLLRNYYVREELLNKLAKENFEGKRLQDLVSTYGEYITEILERLGYKIRWKNIQEAVVVR